MHLNTPKDPGEGAPAVGRPLWKVWPSPCWTWGSLLLFPPIHAPHGGAPLCLRLQSSGEELRKKGREGSAHTEEISV